jgi:glycosyltransferase involved in cell wall biosynthesis
MNGSWSALICKLLLGKPLVLRTGFTLSKALLVNSFLKRVFCRIIERLMYRFADYSIVTSMHDKIFIESIYKVKRIKIIPNLVDTDNFKDLHLFRDTKSLLYVGRLSEDKNLFNLIEAVSNVRLKLVLYGSGPLKDQLISFAKHVSAEVQFKDPISNFLLPEIYNKYAFYILVSPKEGMPKTLIEAMACGCICIGTDVEGINEIITNGKNGLLIRDTSVNSIEFVLRRIIKRQIDTFASLKKNSLSHTKNLYSLETVAEMEAEVLRLVANGGS